MFTNTSNHSVTCTTYHRPLVITTDMGSWVGKTLKERRYGFHAYLLGLTLIALMPLVLVSAVAVWQAGAAYKQTANIRLRDTARTIASAIESDIDGRFTFLNEFASSRVAANKFEPARLVPSPFDGIGFEGDIEFVDLKGQLPTHMSELGINAGREAIATHEPFVSNMQVGKTRKDHRLFLALPVGDPEVLGRAIVLSAAPDQIIRALQLSNIGLDGMLVGVTDGNGRIIARSRDADQVIGRMAPDWDKLIALGSDSGWFEAMTTEGRLTVLSFQTLRDTPGWRVVVGEPLDVFNARWRDPLVGLGMGGAIAICLATLLAFAIGRKIIHPVVALAEHCQRIAGGGAPNVDEIVPTSYVREFEILREAVFASERTQSEQERRLTAVAQVGALVLWRAQAAGGLAWVRGWRELTGAPDSEAFGSQWFSKIHPGDRRRLLRAFVRIQAQRGAVDLEFRLSVGEKVWTWVRARGAPICNEQGDLLQWEGVLEDIDERKQAEARVAHMAHHDVLTGLANRTLLSEKLRQAVTTMRQDVGSALFSLDLDRFKDVNDTLGHPIGDALLKAVADRLRSCLREADFVARVGGDEFNIIQYDSPQPESAAALAGRLIQIVSAPYEIQGHRIIIGTSVGITLITGEPLDVDQYLQQADKALYRSKNLGRGRAYFFEREHMLEQMTAVLEYPAPTKRQPEQKVS